MAWVMAFAEISCDFSYFRFPEIGCVMLNRPPPWKNNVVFACLPTGVIGTLSAARVANQMLQTFEVITFGLMVVPRRWIA